ncbi:hypothetical protein EK904_003756 [Melospiza melodia maxima]|nr:hypothetical protein EK904_003756 [Melospiza melodia maxima]
MNKAPLSKSLLLVPSAISILLTLLFQHYQKFFAYNLQAVKEDFQALAYSFLLGAWMLSAFFDLLLVEITQYVFGITINSLPSGFSKTFPAHAPKHQEGKADVEGYKADEYLSNQNRKNTNGDVVERFFDMFGLDNSHESVYADESEQPQSKGWVKHGESPEDPAEGISKRPRFRPVVDYPEGQGEDKSQVKQCDPCGSFVKRRRRNKLVVCLIFSLVTNGQGSSTVSVRHQNCSQEQKAYGGDHKNCEQQLWLVLNQQPVVHSIHYCLDDVVYFQGLEGRHFTQAVVCSLTSCWMCLCERLGSVSIGIYKLQHKKHCKGIVVAVVLDCLNGDAELHS